jgi:plasmid stabilization system protein ParE
VVSELVFLFSADADIQSAYNFYEALQPGRGEVFMRQLDVALGHLRSFPEIVPHFLGPYRRLLIAGFPYGVFYSIEGNRIIVTAVMDLRQNAETIRRRLIR